MTNEVPIKMVISNSELESSIINTKHDNQSLAYIILQNNKLLSEYVQVKQEITTIENDKEELEMEIDSLTKSKTCLQGYVKNEIEFAEAWETVASVEELQKKEMTKYVYFSTVGLFVLNCLQFVPIMIPYFKTIIMTIATMLSSYVCIKTHTSFKKMKNNTIMIDAKNKINKIKKSNMYIQELIDNA